VPAGLSRTGRKNLLESDILEERKRKKERGEDQGGERRERGKEGERGGRERERRIQKRTKWFSSEKIQTENYRLLLVFLIFTYFCLSLRKRETVRSCRPICNFFPLVL
jgi:hypothetical protein